MSLPPLVKLLDSRPRASAEAMPTLDSVNIPLEELQERLSELPARRVFLADIECYMHAKFLLESGGRVVEVTACQYSKEKFVKSPKATARLWSPSDFVVQQASNITPGRALDLGCGIGRDTCYMASESWKVVAIDNLARTLGRAKKFAQFYSEPSQIEFVHGDCFEKMPLGPFDLVLSMMLYSSRLPELVASRLNPGGLWLVEAYSREYQSESGHPANPDRAVKLEDFEKLTEFEVVEGWTFHTPHSIKVQAALRRK